MLKTLVELQGQVLSNRGAEGQSDLALALKALSDQANSHQRAVKLSKDEAKETQDAVVIKPWPAGDDKDHSVFNWGSRRAYQQPSYPGQAAVRL